MILYLSILLLKVVENTLATLRLIIVANGKKKLGSVLQGLVTISWIYSAKFTIVNLDKDLLKIFFFVVGSIIGSYLGSRLEERIALGSNSLMCIVNKKYESNIIKNLNNYKITRLSCMDKDYSILLIVTKRKFINNICKIIKGIDSNCIIIVEKAKFITNIV